MLRVLIFGSRDLDESNPLASPVWTTLDGIAFPLIPDAPWELVEGGCPTGADAIARHWLANSPAADPECVTGRTFPAEWDVCIPGWCQPGHRKLRPGTRVLGDTYCPVAGFRRNELMAAYLAGHGHSQAWGFVNKRLRDSHGSHDMAMRLWRHSVPFQVVQVVTPPAGPPRNVAESFRAYAGAM
jgi:hypothetical protein